MTIVHETGNDIEWKEVRELVIGECGSAASAGGGGARVGRVGQRNRVTCF